MKGHGAKFSRKMEEAVAALLTQRNHEEAARAIGIGTATLLRWQKEPEFQKAYREAREAIFNHAAKAIEIEDIEARVSELERAAEAQKRKQ